MRKLLARVKEHFSIVPLSRQMTRLLVAVLTVALALAGTLLIGVLKRHLLGQVDHRLRVSAEELATQISKDDLPGQKGPVPSEYYLRVTSEDGDAVEFLTPATEDKAGRPDLLLSEAKVTEILESGVSAPYTVRSTVPGAAWRAFSIPVRGAEEGSAPWVVTVALPLLDTTEILGATALSFFWLRPS